MSKQVVLKAKIQNANAGVLQHALQNMAEHLNAQLMDVNKFNIWNSKTITAEGTVIKLPDSLYPVDVSIKNGGLQINGDEMDMANAKRKIEQFYKMTSIQQQKQAEMEYDSNKKKLRLHIPEWN